MNFWLWVAKKDAIIGEEGSWGDCGPDVEPGDLCLIYHKSRKSWIEELALVTSDPSSDCPIETQRGFTIYGHCCNYKIIHEFVNPLQYKEMKINPILSDWILYNKNLQGMFFSIDEVIWGLLDEKLKEKNKKYKGYEHFII